MKLECPKCGSKSAWYEKTRTDLALKCLCGYYRVVFTTLVDGTTIEHRDKSEEVKLPKEGTHLRATLMALVAVEPANSREITQALNDLGKPFTVSDVSSYLTMLRVKGLVDSLDNKRGVPGGSTWELTDAASELLGL